MEVLAIDMYSKSSQYFSAEQVSRTCAPYFTERQREELDFYVRDFLSSSFLVRRGDSYTFSHKSLMEYLVARNLVKAIATDDLSIIGSQVIPKEIRMFIAEEVRSLDEDDKKRALETLYSWVLLTRLGVDQSTMYLGGNALTLIADILIGDLDKLKAILGENRLAILEGVLFPVIDLSGVDIRMADISGADAIGVNFSNANLNNVNFTHCRMDWFTRGTIPVRIVKQFKIYDIGHIRVYSPNGEQISLPAHATALDFAFYIHTDIGLSTNGAKVDGRVVPLRYQLQHGDVIEILRSGQPKPSLDWLNFVATQKAREEIKRYFRNI